MRDKYLSIITNFGCHFKCPYCITKNNNIEVPKTTIEGLDMLEENLKIYDCDIISISGGGDPLFQYEQNIEWYRKLFLISRYSLKKSKVRDRPIPIEMHTSYLTNESTFPFYDCYRVVYHLNTVEQLKQIKRTGTEKVRVVYVVTNDFTLQDIMDIALFVSNSSEIDELSFCQLVEKDYQENQHLKEYLKLGHMRFWWYIEQSDYNIYYAENKIYDEYRRIGE